jgi:hypothetical protein
MAPQEESSLSPDDAGLINPLVSQLSVEPYVDMDTGFANGYVVGIVIRFRVPYPHFLIYIYSAQRSEIRRKLTIPLAS